VITNKDSVNSVSVPITSVTLDHYVDVNPDGAIMFDWTQGWGYYTTAVQPAGTDPSVPAVAPLTPTEQDVPVGDAYGTATLIRTSFDEGYIVVPPGEYAVLWFEAHLAFSPEWMTEHTPPRMGAGPIPGSSGHGQLAMDGVGAQDGPGPERPVASRTISGVKFNDYDRDTVQDPGEPGLEGWTITLQGPTRTIST